MNAHIVYAQMDESNRISRVNSSVFLKDTEGWTKIDEGHGDRYGHAQNNYFEQPIMDERGICRYKLVDGIPVERTKEEMDADYTEPESKPSDAQRIAALEEQLDMLLSGVTADE